MPDQAIKKLDQFITSLRAPNLRPKNHANTTCRQAVEEDQIVNFEKIPNTWLVQFYKGIVGVCIASNF